MTKGSSSRNRNSSISMFPKVRSLFSRRSSGSSSASTPTSPTEQHSHSALHKRPRSARSRSSFKVPQSKPSTLRETLNEDVEAEEAETQPHAPEAATTTSPRPDTNVRRNPQASPLPLPTPDPSPLSRPASQHDPEPPTVTVQIPSPPGQSSSAPDASKPAPTATATRETPHTNKAANTRNIHVDTAAKPRPLSAGRRSLLESRPRSPLYQTFLAREPGASSEQTNETQPSRQSLERSSKDYEPTDYFSASPSTYTSQPRTPPNMAQSPNRYPQAYVQQQPRKRRIWVKRPGASATMVSINEDDMVDDARDMILRKYGNSLGKSYDSPDVTLRIHPREQPHSSSQRSSSAQQATPSPLQEERVLRPDEILSRTMDVYFPGGQSVEEALLIDVPPPPPHHRARRTPRHSPLPINSQYRDAYANHYEDSRPTESDQDYFPKVLVAPQRTITAHSPGVIGQMPVLAPGAHPHSIAVLNGNPLPPLPSPGAAERGSTRDGKRHREHRPKYGRTHTSSPTIVQSASHAADARPNIASAAQVPPPPLGTPPHPGAGLPLARTATPPPPRVSSPRPAKPKRPKKTSTGTGQPLSASGPSSGILATVPPINVLVVEDNIINLRLLEAFLKRLKVRSHSAMNGREAVNKWRQGGFHLVLMDIQLPVMNGLDATKEIRRLEKVNGVGAFVKTAEEERAEKGRGQEQEAESKSGENEKPEEDEKEQERNRLGNRELFKSPVIIVALTASSLHSDRSEALAAGCNDFLTKPVNLAWLERKLKEWGCMQALIDFDGWRQWKDFQSSTADAGSAAKGATKSGHKRVPSSLSRQSQIMDSKGTEKPVPSSTDPSAVACGVTAPPTAGPAAILDMSARTESQESTATIDSMTSDDADSLDTAMPPRPAGQVTPGISSPPGPNVLVQGPTPRQSVEGEALPRVDTGASGARSSSTSPKIGSSATSPRSLSSLSLSSTGDGAGDNPHSDRDRSAERRRRATRSSLGQNGGLTAVEEREGEEGRGEVEVGA